MFILLTWLCHQDPIIFRGLKSLTFNDTQQTSLLRLAAEGISVSPFFPSCCIAHLAMPI